MPTILETQEFHIPHECFFFFFCLSESITLFFFMRVRVHCCVSLPKTKLSCFRGSAPSAAWCCAEVWSPLAAGCAEAAAASGGGGGGSWRTGLGLMEHTGQHKVGDHSQGVRRYQPTALFNSKKHDSSSVCQQSELCVCPCTCVGPAESHPLPV